MNNADPYGPLSLENAPTLRQKPSNTLWAGRKSETEVVFPTPLARHWPSVKPNRCVSTCTFLLIYRHILSDAHEIAWSVPRRNGHDEDFLRVRTRSFFSFSQSARVKVDDFAFMFVLTFYRRSTRSVMYRIYMMVKTSSPVGTTRGLFFLDYYIVP